MGIDIITLRQELEDNNYTSLNLPIKEIKVKRPTIALLLKHSLLPSHLYNKVFEIVDPDEFNRQNAFAPYRHPEEKERNIFTLIKELTLGTVDEVEFISWEGVAGELSRELMVGFAIGDCEPVTSKDLEDYALNTLKYDALIYETAVSVRLGLTATIVGYDIDLAAGLYRMKHRDDWKTRDFEFHAALAGRQLQKGTKR